MTDRELMQQALEALEYIEHNYMSLPAPAEKAVTALRERLAQPEQSYPDNFIDALKYDVAKRDFEAQQAYEDAFVNGTGVMIGDKRIDPASIYKEPEQEPVAWMHPDGRIWTFGRGLDKSTFTIPLYTTTPHRKPLTDEQKLMCWSRATCDADVEHKTEHQCLMDYGAEIEAAHGIKE